MSIYRNGPRFGPQGGPEGDPTEEIEMKICGSCGYDAPEFSMKFFKEVGFVCMDCKAQVEKDEAEVIEANQDRSCDECGSIHKNGISWHGRCYHCGGELKAIDLSKLERIAVTPGGIELFQEKTNA